jgi:hypothetical protein
MTTVETIVAATHLLFAGVWTGSVVFFAFGILPVAARGDMDAAPLSSVAGSLKTVSRISALLLFLTGGHMAGTLYTVDSLLGSTTGWLVLCMLGLWFVLAGLVEVGTAKVIDGTEQRKVREPARSAKRLLQAAAVVAGVLLIDGGLLTVLT